MQVLRQDLDSLRQFIRQISKISLLSQEEVLGYAKQLQRMRHLLELKQELSIRLSREPSCTQWATQAQLTATALKASLQEGQRAKRKLIEANLLLVVSIARRYQNRGVELQDLIQEGTIGLSRAVDKFDPTAGRCFSAYAYWWIRREISRAATAKEKAGTVSSNAALYQSLQPISLNETLRYSESIEMLDVLESEVAQPEEAVANRQRVELVRELVTGLPPKQRDVLLLLYGLKDGKPRSLTQAAEEMGLSRDQVRWAQSVALETLRTKSEYVKNFV